MSAKRSEASPKGTKDEGRRTKRSDKKLIINGVMIAGLISMFLVADSYAMGKRPEAPKEPAAPATTMSEEVEIITPERPSKPEVDIARPTPSSTEAMPQEQVMSSAPEPESVTRIKDIQLALKNAGFDPGPVDGVMGRKTKRAVREFQGANGLKVDGKVGPKTWAALQKYLTTSTTQ